MKEKSALVYSKHNLAGPHLVNQTRFDLDDVAWPKRRQHAFPMNLQAQTASSAQDLHRQSASFNVALRRIGRRMVRRYEVFLDELHTAEVPAILPHDKAAVSKTFSYRNVGLL